MRPIVVTERAIWPPPYTKHLGRLDHMFPDLMARVCLETARLNPDKPWLVARCIAEAATWNVIRRRRRDLENAGKRPLRD